MSSASIKSNSKRDSISINTNPISSHNSLSDVVVLTTTQLELAALFTLTI